MYLLLGALNLQIILLVQQIEFALLGDVADGARDIEEIAVLVVNGKDTQFSEAVHAPFDDDALGAEVKVFCLVVCEQIAEGRQVVERGAEVVGIILALELQYLLHLMVGIHQFAVLVI